jgi:hypothetical protein
MLLLNIVLRTIISPPKITQKYTPIPYYIFEEGKPTEKFKLIQEQKNRKRKSMFS